MASKITKDDLLARIKWLEDGIAKANEYLESGKHADWKAFRPLFAVKRRAGKELPPHRDWVQNVFLPRRERALNRAEKLLQRFAD
jgi:hypothetical protein